MAPRPPCPGPGPSPYRRPCPCPCPGRGLDGARRPRGALEGRGRVCKSRRRRRRKQRKQWHEGTNIGKSKRSWNYGVMEKRKRRSAARQCSGDRVSALFCSALPCPCPALSAQCCPAQPAWVAAGSTCIHPLRLTKSRGKGSFPGWPWLHLPTSHEDIGVRSASRAECGGWEANHRHLPLLGYGRTEYSGDWSSWGKSQAGQTGTGFPSEEVDLQDACILHPSSFNTRVHGMKSGRCIFSSPTNRSVKEQDSLQLVKAPNFHSVLTFPGPTCTKCFNYGKHRKRLSAKAARQ